MTTGGILPDSAIAGLFEAGALASARPLDADQVQPASLDLRLGKRAWRVRASFMPGRGFTVADKLGQLTLHEFDLKAGAVLETGCVYIVELLETLDLPAGIAASAGVQKLLLTHLWPGYDEKSVLSEALPLFPEAQIAREGERYTV